MGSGLPMQAYAGLVLPGFRLLLPAVHLSPSHKRFEAERSGLSHILNKGA